MTDEGLPVTGIIELLPLVASSYVTRVLRDTDRVQVARVRKTAQTLVEERDDEGSSASEEIAAAQVLRAACSEDAWDRIVRCARALGDWAREDRGVLLNGLLRATPPADLRSLDVSPVARSALTDLRDAGALPADHAVDEWDEQFELDHPDVRLRSVASSLEIALAVELLELTLPTLTAEQRFGLATFVRAGVSPDVPEQLVESVVTIVMGSGVAGSRPGRRTNREGSVPSQD